MNHVAACRAIADLVTPLPGIMRADPIVPDSILEPHFYVGEIAIDWTGKQNTFGGNDDVIYLCRLLVAKYPDDEAQGRLKPYMRRTGESSVKAAIEGTVGVPQTLGGLIDDLVVRRFQGHRIYTVGSSRYYGGEWYVQLYGSADEDEE